MEYPDNASTVCNEGSNNTYYESIPNYAKFRIAVDVFLVGPLCLAGLVGNILSIIVLQMDKVNTNLSFLLQALAVADNAYLVCCLLFQTIGTIQLCTDLVSDSLRNAYTYIEPYIYPLASVAQTATVWLVVVVTLDRYIAICCPMHQRPTVCHMRSPTRVRAVVVAVFVTSFAYNIPGFFELQVISAVDPCDANKTYLVSAKTPLRQNSVYYIYKTATFFIFRLGLPLGTVSFLNARLIVTMRCVRQSCANLTRHGQLRERGSVTFLLVCMVSVFIFCELPDFLLRVVLTIFYATGQSTESFTIYYWTTMTNFMLTLNSSVNCIVYCLSGRQFRRMFHRQMSCCLGGSKRGGYGGTGSTAVFGSSLTSSAKYQRSRSVPCVAVLNEDFKTRRGKARNSHSSASTGTLRK